MELAGIPSQLFCAPARASEMDGAKWRRGWDSNPRGLSPCRFSRPEPSTTRPPLQFAHGHSGIAPLSIKYPCDTSSACWTMIHVQSNMSDAREATSAAAQIADLRRKPTASLSKPKAQKRNADVALPEIPRTVSRALACPTRSGRAGRRRGGTAEAPTQILSRPHENNHRSQRQSRHRLRLPASIPTAAANTDAFTAMRGRPMSISASPPGSISRARSW